VIELSYVIPVRNDAERLARCLASIRGNSQNAIRSEIVVCDNGSTDQTQQVARDAGAVVLDLPGRRVSELRNTAVGFAKGRYLAFVDADHVIDEAWSETALRTFSDASVAAVGALYTSPAQGTWVQRAYGALRGTTRGQQTVDWLGSGNLAVRREAFEQVGGFDTTLEACEDVDFCKRLRAAGWRIVADERLRSLHLGDPPTLRALFRAERWRGRNNVRVSLRPPHRLADLPSLIIPFLVLAAIGTLLGSLILLLGGHSAGLPALGALAVLAGISVLKTLRAAARAGRMNPAVLVPLWAVVLTYEIARATALVSRARHHRP
jgi:GT2 family glycosyltransferase